MRIDLDQVTTPENFNERDYLASNPDVAAAVSAGKVKSGRKHFDAFGHSEKRPIRLSSAFASLRKQKMERLAHAQPSRL